MSGFGQQPFMGQSGYMPPDVAMYQQRLNNMAQQVMQGQPNSAYGNMFTGVQMPVGNMGMNMVQQQNYNVRAVTGYEEALASQTPLDGSVSILIDRNHGMIYTKQLNMNDGNPLMRQYKLSDPVEDAAVSVTPGEAEYVQKSEFDELKGRFEEVWKALTEKPENTKSTSKKEGSK